jgi:hypothetical protein
LRVLNNASGRNFISNFSIFICHSLTHGAQPFLRSRQLCSCSRTSQHFMEPGGSLPCSQEPSTGPYPIHYINIYLWLFKSKKSQGIRSGDSGGRRGRGESLSEERSIQQSGRLAVLANSKTQNPFLSPVLPIFCHDCPLAVNPASTPWSLLPKQMQRDSVPNEIFLSTVSFLIAALPSSEVPEGLTNYPT